MEPGVQKQAENPILPRFFSLAQQLLGHKISSETTYMKRIAKYKDMKVDKIALSSSFKSVFKEGTSVWIADFPQRSATRSFVLCLAFSCCVENLLLCDCLILDFLCLEQFHQQNKKFSASRCEQSGARVENWGDKSHSLTQYQRCLWRDVSLLPTEKLLFWKFYSSRPWSIRHFGLEEERDACKWIWLDRLVDAGNCVQIRETKPSS